MEMVSTTSDQILGCLQGLRTKPIDGRRMGHQDSRGFAVTREGGWRESSSKVAEFTSECSIKRKTQHAPTTSRQRNSSENLRFRTFNQPVNSSCILPKPNKLAIVTPIPPMPWMEPSVESPELWGNDKNPIRHPVELAEHPNGVHYMLHNVGADERTKRLVRVGKCMGVAVTDFGTWSVEVTIDVAPQCRPEDRRSH
jgi:hypothetical protein